MSPFARIALLPRIPFAIGVVAIVISNFAADRPRLHGGLQIAGGVTASVGVIWFVTVLSRKR